jgi:hypothetical protein
LVFVLLFFSLNADRLSGSTAGIKGGFSLMHDYQGLSKPGFNIKLSYDPYLDYSINIDTAVFVYYAQNGLDHLVYPGVSVGTRYNVNIYPVTKLYIGSGLSFIAGIDYSKEEDEADAFFTPGFYIKLGSMFVTGRSVSLGLETEYVWSMSHLNHIFSVNFRVDILI